MSHGIIFIGFLFNYKFRLINKFEINILFHFLFYKCFFLGALFM